ncbi:MAG: hypothetical protein K8F24_03730, partial [Bacteroidales bacterium]|nr:hypothetical protein [Bacteroidales bacterium]
RISFDYLSFDTLRGEQFFLIANYLYKGKSIKYRGFGLNDKNPGTWKSFTIDYMSPELTSTKNQFQTYIWAKEDSELLIDNFSVILFEPKQTLE